MKLSNDTIAKLNHIVSAADMIGINGIIIDKESIRGQSEDNSIIVVEKDYLPTMDFDAIGISRVKVLQSRLALISKNNDKPFSIEAKIKEKDSGERTVLSLSIKDNKTTVEFKCMDPAYIKAPKNLKSPIQYSFNITADSVDFMSRSNSAMSHKNIAFECRDNTVTFKLTDVEGDALTHVVATDVTIIDENDSKEFFFKFNKNIISLLKLALKEADTVKINLTKRGILNIKISNINVYLVQDFENN